MRITRGWLLIRAVAAALMTVVLATTAVAPATAWATPATGAALSAVETHGAKPARGPDSHSVPRLYHAYFLRSPDPAGLAYWNDQFARGVSLSHISLHFSDSSEFRRTYGHLDDGAFVRLVYRNVMDREPDADGYAHWTRVLAEGRLSRGGVMIGFSDSVEFKIKTDLYDDVGDTAPVAPPGSFVFYDVDEFGRPMRWNPCAPIDVVVNLSQAPHIRPVVGRAVEAMSAATGVQWRIIGDTTEQLVVSGPGSVSDRDYRDGMSRYGQRWAPVLLTVPTVYNDSSTAGMASAVAVWGPNGAPVIVTGLVVLNRHFVSHPLVSDDELFHLVIHELGHVFGLDHTSVPGQVMSTGDSWPTEWGAGDLAGFRALTQGGCLQAPPVFPLHRAQELLLAG